MGNEERGNTLTALGDSMREIERSLADGLRQMVSELAHIRRTPPSRSRAPDDLAIAVLPLGATPTARRRYMAFAG